MLDEYDRLQRELTNLHCDLDCAYDRWRTASDRWEVTEDVDPRTGNPTFEDTDGLEILGPELSPASPTLPIGADYDFLPEGLSDYYGDKSGGDRSLPLGRETSIHESLLLNRRAWDIRLREKPLPSDERRTGEQERALSSGPLGETRMSRSAGLQKRKGAPYSQEELRRSACGIGEPDGRRKNSDATIWFAGTKEILAPSPKKAKRWRVINHIN